MTEDASDDSNDLRKLKVLVVDDQSTMINLIVSVLRTIGIEKIRALKSAAKAIQFLDTQETIVFDLVLSDWDMPEVSGLEFLNYIRKRDPNMPFLMLTGNADKEHVLQAKQAGVSSYICKPFSADSLEEKIRKIMAV